MITSSAPRLRRSSLVRTVAPVLALLFPLVLLAGPAATAAPARSAAVATTAERITGERVVVAALDRLGTPYAWGGGSFDGPTLGFCDGVNGYLDGVCMADHTVGFDCSGLARYAWYQATEGAVALPHYSVAQLAVGRRIPLDQVIPGDLLFFAGRGGPVHHVGIYAGNGAMIHAEHTGTVVTVLPDVAHDPLWGPQLVAAARPVPLQVPGGLLRSAPVRRHDRPALRQPAVLLRRAREHARG
ncbi:C40 family peptidase [Streptacidiphilus sp. PB12-B1b]|uniref:C40 family peptidase n=1 Tax=Streptacidiphilus sp. PB12-B1b TaxID=2705012 RepID=UPI0015FAA120|nr:C40 family peptidase [Streptacidiphilus sp. PB12-B1b]QMU76648.1 C40 family peptidase [Streptacidiphilus sp. PB12-B1b]